MEKKLLKLYYTIDDRKDKYIERLKQFIAIKSISEEKTHRLDVVKALRWIAFKLLKLGADVRMKRAGRENIYTGDEIPLTKTDELELPDIVIAAIGKDKTKRTLLIYGHVDVKPVYESEQWTHDPFDMQIKNGYLHGRGVTDDKGPLLGWINVIEAFQKTNIPLPINIKFVIEGMEEVGSEGLSDVLNILSLGFFKNVNYVAISDNYWLGQTTPCLTYGLRGVVYFYITVEGASRILHSGCHGGAIYEPLADLNYLLNSLTDNQGNILVPGIYDEVKEIDPEEIKRFEKLNFDLPTYQRHITTPGLLTYDKVDILRRRWCLPSLSIHGIEHSFDKPGAPTLIPRKVMGKFSIRIVPDQPPKLIASKVISYLRAVHQLRRSSNRLDIKVFRDGRPFLGDHTSPNYIAAYRAIQKVWKVPPDLTRDGASIPAALALEESTRRDVVLIPMGQSLDYQHEGNERLSIENYINGMKVFAAYFYELAVIETENSEDEEIRQTARDQWRAKML